MTANTMKYFPEGLALGDYFLNRVTERDYLISRIKSNKHTILMAPRRYGKTSLVTKVAGEMNLAYCSIDLLAAYSEEYVRNQIVNKVSQLVFELFPNLDKAKSKLITIFKQMKPEISVGAFGQKLTLNLSNYPLQDITDVLLKLDETAKNFKKQAVIFLDEFQQISQLVNHNSIEASIRHAVERSENISYVFSGSDRHLLQQMFGDHSRPLYRLCQTLTLERMEKKVYIERLQKLAKAKWKKKLADAVLERIFIQTELHPFYMNVLCQIIWEENHIPAAESIDRIWHNYVIAQRQIISSDIMKLSLNQKKIIIALAASPTTEIQSTNFTAPLKISASSAQQSTAILRKNDLVYKDIDGFFRILDPAMRYFLNVIL
ncbi:MAG: ATP-binding protein [Gammaproteobacteria bacterium]|nr:ATP-binding protein [Gammaproteobacteria bacterium]